MFLGRKQFQFLDMVSDRNWATAGFDVLIVRLCVCVCVRFTPLKLRLIDETKHQRQRGREWKWRWCERQKELKTWSGRVTSMP